MVIYQNSTKFKPLQFFETFLKKQNLEEYERVFYNYPINASQTCNLEDGYIEYLLDSYVNEPVKLQRIYFRTRLESLLKNNLALTISLIEEREVELNYQNIKDDIFIERQIIKVLRIKNLITKEQNNYKSIIEVVNMLEEFIIKKRILPQSTLKSPKLKFSKSYFNLQEKVSPKHLKRLYSISVQHEIIDRFSISEEDFLNIFTSAILPSENYKFTFYSDNRSAVVYLKAIKPLFKNLTASRIEESKTFYTKQGKNKDSKLLNANDFYKVNNFLKNSTSSKYNSLEEDVKSCFPDGL